MKEEEIEAREIETQMPWERGSFKKRGRKRIIIETKRSFVRTRHPEVVKWELGRNIKQKSGE